MSWVRRACSSHSALGNQYSRIVSSMLAMSAGTIVQKKIRIGVRCWWTLMSRIRYNLESIQEVVVWMASHTNVLWAVNANWNSGNDGWNVEANSVENPNRWSADNQVVSRNSRLFPSPLGGGFFAIIPLFHPPTMRPISSTSFPSDIKWLCAMSPDSHAIWIKKRTASTARIASSSGGNFWSIDAYAVLRSASNKLSQSLSIRSPIPKRSERAIFR